MKTLETILIILAPLSPSVRTPSQISDVTKAITDFLNIISRGPWPSTIKADMTAAIDGLDETGLRLLGSDYEDPTHTLLPLPHLSLSPLYSTLHFPNNIKSTVTSYLLNTLLLSSLGLKKEICSLNRLILLTGPPGTGKTTLALSVAQRLSEILGSGILIRIHSSSLFSKWFSESGKKVDMLFNAVKDISEDYRLAVVLVDEVESLVSSRNNESMIEDGVRGVNAVLTGLDMIKNLDGVVVICTSNLVEGSRVDEAFLSRCDGVWEVEGPGGEGVGRILRETIDELKRVNVLTVKDDDKLNSKLLEAGKRGTGKSGREIRKAVVKMWSEMGGGMGIEASDVLDALWS
ncbi:hypothetical protein TL16_g04350 [Triparma laevis f. inornata]|uniref:AAA+ ATPase domain-containing protein n=1 Tax=Triparma laevis f. inornata TaxID=1714386 RepID=A0A9W7A5B8_9STRA|nr:hypothetical protein TL16_g04350 [Triparma laevis f. inornata]